MRRELCVAPRVFTSRDVADSKEALERVFRARDVQVALLFGSLAAGSQAGGDLDLAVEFRPEGRGDWLVLYDDLCRLFRADNIDVVPLDRAPFALRARALLDGEILFERAGGRVQRMVEDLLRVWDDERYAAKVVWAKLSERLTGGLSMAERRVDRERVAAYLSQLDLSVAKLTRLRAGVTSYEAFVADEDRRDLVVHHLRIALESLLDVCRHYLAATGVTLAELDTTNLIELAGTRGLLTTAFARDIRGMAGMRNAIVHAYVNLDNRAIYEMLAHRLSDFGEFGRQVRAYLEREGAG